MSERQGNHRGFRSSAPPGQALRRQLPRRDRASTLAENRFIRQESGSHPGAGIGRPSSTKARLWCQAAAEGVGSGNGKRRNGQRRALHPERSGGAPAHLGVKRQKHRASGNPEVAPSSGPKSHLAGMGEGRHQGRSCACRELGIEPLRNRRSLRFGADTG